MGVVGHFFKDWKPTVYDKSHGSTTKKENCTRVNKCQKEFRMFNEQNINELINERPADTTSFRSCLVGNKHVPPEVYFACDAD